MRKLSESVWGDIRKKSLGQEEREENKMSPEDLVNYLNSVYEFDSFDKPEFIHDSNLISIPIVSVQDGMFSDWELSLNYHIKESIIFSKKEFGKKYCQNLYNKLCDTFHIESTEDGYISIIPDGEMNHLFLLSVLDIIVNENINEGDIIISRK